MQVYLQYAARWEWALVTTGQYIWQNERSGDWRPSLRNNRLLWCSAKRYISSGKAFIFNPYVQNILMIYFAKLYLIFITSDNAPSPASQVEMRGLLSTSAWYSLVPQLYMPVVQVLFLATTLWSTRWCSLSNTMSELNHFLVCTYLNITEYMLHPKMTKTTINTIVMWKGWSWANHTVQSQNDDWKHKNRATYYSFTQHHSN